VGRESQEIRSEKFWRRERYWSNACGTGKSRDQIGVLERRKILVECVWDGKVMRSDRRSSGDAKDIGRTRVGRESHEIRSEKFWRGERYWSNACGTGKSRDQIGEVLERRKILVERVWDGKVTRSDRRTSTCCPYSNQLGKKGTFLNMQNN
jgi:hypothetical protein